MEWSLLGQKHGLLEMVSGELTTFIRSRLVFIGLFADMKWIPSTADRRARRLTGPHYVIPQKSLFSAYLAFIVWLELQNQGLLKMI